jgi:uncharacterized protein YjeT (DUF2065 family)
MQLELALMLVLVVEGTSSLIPFNCKTQIGGFKKSVRRFVP